MKALLSLFLAIAPLAVASAQTSAPTPPTNPSETESSPRFWQASFANGGHYLAKLDRISSASKHEYISDGVARVVEVTIGTDTAVVARFYYLEPVGKDTPINAGKVLIDRAQEVAKEAASRVAPGVAKLNVVKNYPASTHAHTVEFVVQDEATLNSLYTSLMAALNTGRGRTWKESSDEPKK